jgi:hypothetical protein
MTKTAPDKWGTPIHRDLSGVEILRNQRGVKTFTDFPQSTQDIYLRVAKCFPGWQVYAVGSRVRGDYVDRFEGVAIYAARYRAGMKSKIESDFDFLVSPDAVQVVEFPANTERVRCRIPENERIEIPIFYGNGMELE